MKGPRMLFDTVTNAASATIPSSENAVVAGGFAAVGDSQEPLNYRRRSSAPTTHTMYFQSADGAYWEYTPGPNGVNLVAAGATTGATNNSPAWEKAAVFAEQYGVSVTGYQAHFCDLFVPANVFKFTESIRWNPGCFGVSAYGACLIFSSAAAHGVHVQSSVPEDGTAYRQNRSVFRGAVIYGANVSGSDGLRFVPSAHTAAHICIRDCVVLGWHRGTVFGANAYLIKFENCGFIFNNYGITDMGWVANGGENISFCDCVIAGNQISGTALANPSGTYNFVNCSIDHNGEAPTGGQYQLSVYDAVATFTNCHIEGFTKPIILGNNLYGTTNSKISFHGGYLLNSNDMGSTPFVDIQDGGYVTFIGVMLAANPGTDTPIKVRSGGSFVDVDCYYNYPATVIDADSGSRRNSLNPILVP